MNDDEMKDMAEICFGAAVRGEAVAVHPRVMRKARYERIDGIVGTDYVQFGADNRYGHPIKSGETDFTEAYHREDVESWVAKGTWREIDAPVSPRAADAPSDPSEKLYFVRMTKTDGWREASEAAYWTFSEVNRRILYESRAADALDSQPTDDAQQGSIGEDERFHDLIIELDLASKSAYPRAGATRQQYAINELIKMIDSRASSAPVAPVAPDGWKLVPIKATQELIDAIEDAAKAETSVEWDANLGSNTHFGDAENVYAAMLAAAPAPQQEGSEAGNG